MTGLLLVVMGTAPALFIIGAVICAACSWSDR